MEPCLNSLPESPQSPETFVHWTPKMVYDKLVETSKAGLFPSSTDLGRCLYRWKDRKCAFGLFIPDRLYIKTMDCPQNEPGQTRHVITTALYVINQYPEVKENLPPWSLVEGFWRGIQAAHDRLHPWDHDIFVSKIQDVFDEYGLDITQ